MQPFVRQVTATKAATLLLDSVQKNPRFSKLETEKQFSIIKGAKEIREGRLRPLTTKFRFSGAGLTWAVLSLLICFFLLFYIEGAHHAAWLLPVACIVYAFSLTGEVKLKGENIFPPEKEITQKYLQADENFKKRRDEIAEAWNRYLVAEWGTEGDLDEAVFNFNVARADWVINKRGEDAVVAHLLFHPSIVQVLAYFIWNLLFAWRINRYTKFEARSHASSSAPA